MSRPAATRPALDAVDRALINRLQLGLPLVDAPYAAVGAELGLSEAELLQRLQSLLDRRVLTRFGPLFHAERLGGALLLAALAVPQDDFERIAALVNAFPEVAHNYEREHALNMWFVLATATPAALEAAILGIEAATGLPVHRFPKLEEFYVGLYLPA